VYKAYIAATDRYSAPSKMLLASRDSNEVVVREVDLSNPLGFTTNGVTLSSDARIFQNGESSILDPSIVSDTEIAISGVSAFHLTGSFATGVMVLDLQHAGILRPAESITINTFIPHEWIPSPFNRPFRRDTIFEGDNRSAGTPLRALWNENGSHRTQHRFNIVTSNASDADGLQDNAYTNDGDGLQNDNQLIHIGTTREYDQQTSLNATNNITPAARADLVLADSNLKIGEATAPKTQVWIEAGWPKRLGNNKVEVKCRCEAVNPLVAGAAAISYTFVFTIDKTDPLKPMYSLAGEHDGFPAYEIYINHIRVHHYDPLVTNEGPGSLLPPAEKSMSQIDKALP
jgi:hypothetical protein